MNIAMSANDFKDMISRLKGCVTHEDTYTDYIRIKLVDNGHVECRACDGVSITNLMIELLEPCYDEIGSVMFLIPDTFPKFKKDDVARLETEDGTLTLITCGTKKIVQEIEIPEFSTMTSLDKVARAQEDRPDEYVVYLSPAALKTLAAIYKGMYSVELKFSRNNTDPIKHRGTDFAANGLIMPMRQ